MDTFILLLKNSLSDSIFDRVSELPSNTVNVNTPFLQLHGTADTTVPLVYAKMTSSLLSGLLSRHWYNEYPGLGHNSLLFHPQQYQHVKTFLSKELPWETAPPDYPEYPGDEGYDCNDT